MIAPEAGLSISRQCTLLGLVRSSFYYRPRPESAEELDLLKRLDRIFTGVRPATPKVARQTHVDGIRPESQVATGCIVPDLVNFVWVEQGAEILVRSRLPAGGSRIRTAGPTCDADDLRISGFSEICSGPRGTEGGYGASGEEMVTSSLHLQAQLASNEEHLTNRFKGRNATRGGRP
jgi:hypothetical protein